MKTIGIDSVTGGYKVHCSTCGTETIFPIGSDWSLQSYLSGLQRFINRHNQCQEDNDMHTPVWINFLQNGERKAILTLDQPVPLPEPGDQVSVEDPPNEMAHFWVAAGRRVFRYVKNETGDRVEVDIPITGYRTS